MTILPILPAGNGAGLTAPAAPKGISGLFASLFSMFNTGESSLTTPLSEGISPDISIEKLLGEMTPELQKFADFIIEATNQHGIKPADIIVEFKSIVVEVQQIEVQFGSINNISDLAIAYEKLGFTPTEAIEKAEQVSLIAQLLEAFQKHTLGAVNIEEIQNTSGILQANEDQGGLVSPAIRMTEIRQTAIAFTATINMVPQTDFVSQIAAKIPLLKNQGEVAIAKNNSSKELILPSTGSELSTPLTEVSDILLNNDEGLLLDTLFPQEVPFASMQAMLKEVIPAPSQQIKVAEFASAIEEKHTPQKPIHKHVADVAVKTAEITTTPNAMAKDAPKPLTVEGLDSAEVVTIRNAAESGIEHQQKQATPVLRAPVENTVSNKETRSATSASFANHNGTEVRNVNVLTPVTGKPVIQMQPNETGEIQIINSINGEQLEAETEELRFAERLERNISTAKHNNNIAKVAERAQVSEQINIQVKNLVEKGGGHIRMTLNPAELGKVDIQLQIMDGKVQGTILSQNLEVIEQMARDLRSLQQGLAEAGLELDTKGIQFQLRDENDSSQQHASNQGSDDENNLEEELENTMASNWTDPDKIIDVSI